MTSFLDHSIGYNMNMAALILKRELQNQFNQHRYDVTTEQWAVLNRLWENDGKTQSELALTTFKDHANITRMIDLLEKKGLVLRKDDPQDRRSKLIYLTEKGKAMQEKLVPLAQEVLHRALQGITQEEVAFMNQLSDRIIQNLV